MKKENNNNNNTTDLFESFLPDRVKDDPNANLKKEKKLYTIIFIVVCSLLLVANLISMIISFCISITSGFNALFVGFINCAISIFVLGLLIVVAHNISKMTRATLFMCSKMMRDEKRYLESTKSEEEDNDDLTEEEEQPESESEEDKDIEEDLDID